MSVTLFVVELANFSWFYPLKSVPKQLLARRSQFLKSLHWWLKLWLIHVDTCWYMLIHVDTCWYMLIPLNIPDIPEKYENMTHHAWEVLLKALVKLQRLQEAQETLEEMQLKRMASLVASVGQNDGKPHGKWVKWGMIMMEKYGKMVQKSRIKILEDRRICGH